MQPGRLVRIVGLILICCVAMSACAVIDDSPSTASDTRAIPASQSPLVEPSATPTVSPTPLPTATAVPPPTPTPSPTPTPTPTPLPVACAVTNDPANAVPLSVQRALEVAANHPGLEDLTVSASIWIDGWGEVFALNPDAQLNPASNQKLLVGLAAHSLLDLDQQLRTTIEVSRNDLVVRAAADPTLTMADVDQMAAQVAATGIVSADQLVIDVTAFPQLPTASGWLDFQIPQFVGPLSGLMIDDNRWNFSEAFIANPAAVNGKLIRERLAEAGVAIDAVEVAAAPPGRVVAEHLSPSLRDLVGSTLLTSDNQTADLLLMQLGRAQAGEGTLAAGAGVVEAELAKLQPAGPCPFITGITDDGSGLSRGNLRSARQFQQALRSVPASVANAVRDQLPVSGVSGTLIRRFGAADAGRVLAKTGTLLDARALSGYATTDSGRDAVFSILVNGGSSVFESRDRERMAASLAGIDAIVTAILRITE